MKKKAENFKRYMIPFANSVGNEAFSEFFSLIRFYRLYFAFAETT